jgi:predicted methyltransferase
MTVIEALPGAGWYSKILLRYLGDEGMLIGVDYAPQMWAKFDFMTPEALAKKDTWPADWTARADGWRQSGDARVSAFAFGSLPDQLVGTVDAVLLVRALHNMARFESDGGFMSTAIQEAYRALKPGGILGVVQHEAKDYMPDDWAGGANGYLKQRFVIAAIQRAGFQLLDASDINTNPNDVPTVDDFVWRLPPSLETSRNDRALRARMTAIGESNRMTLKFRKPGT